MRQMLNNPMMQAMMSNPDLMRTMLQSNPMIRQMTEAVGAGVLDNPWNEVQTCLGGFTKMQRRGIVCPGLAV